MAETTTEKVTEVTEDSKRILLVEAVAAELLRCSSPSTTLWRDRTLVERNDARELAALFIEEMEAAGVKLVPNIKKLESFIEELITIPAAKAFEPGK